MDFLPYQLVHRFFFNRISTSQVVKASGFHWNMMQTSPTVVRWVPSSTYLDSPFVVVFFTGMKFTKYGSSEPCYLRWLDGCCMFLSDIKNNWVVVSNCVFSTPIWGNDPIWRAYCSNRWFNHQLDKHNVVSHPDKAISFSTRFDSRISNERDFFEAADYLGHVQCSRVRMALGELWSGRDATKRDSFEDGWTFRQRRWTVKNWRINV